MHYINNCKSVFTRTTKDVRILLLDNQQWIVKNVSSSSIQVSTFHMGALGEQRMRGMKVLPPGSVAHVHAL
jgi:hypothetical protein